MVVGVFGGELDQFDIFPELEFFLNRLFQGSEKSGIKARI